ncbi:hypothetical protein, partial [Pseudomonas sp. USHLN015]|uniref:hypothetical protein n=1 Tax=Pseudomonas sp. USHLN015 TaxID=3081296 RepID=UPI00301C7A08
RRISSFYSTTCASVILSLHISGRRILQRSNSLSTPLFQFLSESSEQTGDALNQPDTTLPPHQSNLGLTAFQLLNPLIYKRFFLDSAVEVVRIIGIRNGTSTLK